MRDNSHEVELKAQRDENSPLFQDSLMQASNNNNAGGMMAANQQQMAGMYGGQVGGVAQNQASHLMHIPAVYRRVTINLEDVHLEEQKLYQVLEVSLGFHSMKLNLLIGKGVGIVSLFLCVQKRFNNKERVYEVLYNCQNQRRIIWYNFLS